MYQTKKSFINASMKMADLIFENPILLLPLEHFELEFLVQDKSVAQLCKENNISEEVFITVANYYNGFHTTSYENFTKADMEWILKFLKNSHNYYENEKYVEIQNLIQRLYEVNDAPEIKLIGKFFDEYFEEVKEHLSYENKIVFPYFDKLLGSENSGYKEEDSFSVNEYREHHSDIQSKLKDLKELLLKHIRVNNDRVLRRKIIVSLSELEYDLDIHSLIEETILIPLISRLETELK